MSNLHTRSTGEFEVRERIVEGIAHAWDSPTTVSDDGKTRYLEQFTRGSSSKTIAESKNKPVPLGYHHPWLPGSIGSKSRFAGETFGSVSFEESAEGLVYRAKISETSTGDEMLALLDDGALGNVSLGFFVEKTVVRGAVKTRTEIRHWELSLVPNGMNADPSAKILAVRAEDLILVPKRRLPPPLRIV